MSVSVSTLKIQYHLGFTSNDLSYKKRIILHSRNRAETVMWLQLHTLCCFNYTETKLFFLYREVWPRIEKQKVSREKKRHLCLYMTVISLQFLTSREHVRKSKLNCDHRYLLIFSEQKVEERVRANGPVWMQAWQTTQSVSKFFMRHEKKKNTLTDKLFLYTTERHRNYSALC